MPAVQTFSLPFVLVDFDTYSHSNWCGYRVCCSQHLVCKNFKQFCVFSSQYLSLLYH